MAYSIVGTYTSKPEENQLIYHSIAHNDYLSAVQAAQHHSEGQTMVVVRVPKHDQVALSTALEAGASAIIIPHCESAKEVHDFIKETYFRKQLSNSCQTPVLFLFAS
jgi:chromosome segregation ATPase